MSEQTSLQETQQRIDLWLHHVCLLKTRSQSTRACNERRIKVNGDTAKPSKMIAVGDTVTIRYPNGRFVDFKVLALALKNISRKQAREYYEIQELELSEETRDLMRIFNESFKKTRPKYKGRPTKKERRKLEEFRRKE